MMFRLSMVIFYAALLFRGGVQDPALTAYNHAGKLFDFFDEGSSSNGKAHRLKTFSVVVIGFTTWVLFWGYHGWNMFTWATSTPLLIFVYAIAYDFGFRDGSLRKWKGGPTKAQVIRERRELIDSLERLQDILCDPFGNPVFEGTDGDRKTAAESFKILERV